MAEAPGASRASERRRELVAGMTAIADYERALVARLITGLQAIRGVTIHGIADPARLRGARADRVRVHRRRPSARRRRRPSVARASSRGTVTSTPRR
ncbi:MAG: hypothetical protein WKF78_07205 [Candidatus Limnocylindrales bacterium]